MVELIEDSHFDNNSVLASSSWASREEEGEEEEIGDAADPIHMYTGAAWTSKETCLSSVALHAKRMVLSWFNQDYANSDDHAEAKALLNLDSRRHSEVAKLVISHLSLRCP